MQRHRQYTYTRAILTKRSVSFCTQSSAAQCRLHSHRNDCRRWFADDEMMCESLAIVLRVLSASSHTHTPTTTRRFRQKSFS